MQPLERKQISQSIKNWGREIGFDLVGIAPVVVGLGIEQLDQWLAAGRHGEMAYMAERRDARRDPSSILPGARSVVMTALAYKTCEPPVVGSGQGRVSRYAWGRDYHDVVREKLKGLGRRIEASWPKLRWRAAVDSAPLMERDYARLAGLGWFGKNTLLLHAELGSWFFLGAILVDLELEYDAPQQSEHCGACTRCLEACPTQAFSGPYQLDPRRCISYLTIEHRSAIEPTLAGELGDWVFGCDVCQEVCPWNARAPQAVQAAFQPRPDAYPLSLKDVLETPDEELARQWTGSPLARSRPAGLKRNAALAAGCLRDESLETALERATRHPNAAVRAAASWALERVQGDPPEREVGPVRAPKNQVE